MNSPWHVERMAKWRREEIAREIKGERLAQFCLRGKQRTLDKVMARLGVSLITLGEHLLARHDPVCHLCYLGKFEVSGKSE